MKKTVVAKLNVKKELKNQFLHLAEQMINLTRQEEGCISYNLYKNSFSQYAEFMFYEEYRNEQALNIHNNSEYLAEFFKDVTPLLASEPVLNNF